MNKDWQYYIDKLKDVFMFREGSYEDNYTTEPKVTLGSIIWGILLRTFVLVFVSIIIALILYQKVAVNWWVIFFLMWVFIAFPAYRQHRKFDERIGDLEESTMCGSCLHFIKDAQLCRVYDEHVSINHLPCQGEDWEPRTFEDEDE